MKTCSEVYSFLCDNLGQEIDSPECREIHKHLESCEECRRSLEGLRRTVTLFQSAPAPSVSPAVHRRLIKALHSAQVASYAPTTRPARRNAPVRRGKNRRHG
jgi:anti-sigma factor RsiW